MIKSASEIDIPCLSKALLEEQIRKSEKLFQNYFKEQKQGQRYFLIAFAKEKPIGYVTLKLQSEYPYFEANQIPEISDLNVLPSMRNQGIGSALLKTAEDIAQEFSNIVGIGVGLYAGSDGGYGSAQRLYIKNGYIPDGHGITYNYQPVIPGNTYCIDDELILWFTKNLK